MSEYLGLLRSILMYYGLPWRPGRLRRFYSQFISPGDLCFDIGAHVGSRLRIWAGLQARVVAVEPQPLFMKFLKRLYWNTPGVTLLECALGAKTGETQMYVSRRTPTVSSLSPEWMAAVRQTRSFSGVRWEQAVSVRVETLDGLIERFGMPAFCKIDVEGYELEILKGLSRPLACLSFEFIPAALDIARGCAERLASLGWYEFNRTTGERMQMEWERWVGLEELCAWLGGLRLDDRSGDIYARLVEEEVL